MGCVAAYGTPKSVDQHTGQRSDLHERECDGPRIEELLGRATGYRDTALALLIKLL